MSNDGVSLQTTISQLGNVAKTQAKDQQTQQPATNQGEKLSESEELKTQRVQQTDQTDRKGVDPESSRRQQRRRKRRRREGQSTAEDDEQIADASDANGSSDTVGKIVDTRV